jgi:hypothetical protein
MFYRAGKQLEQSRIGSYHRSGLEIAHPDNNSAHAHEISALVGTTPSTGRPLHMDETALGNGSGDIGRFGTLAKFVEPVRNVVLGNVGNVITLGHGQTPGMILNFSANERIARANK